MTSTFDKALQSAREAFRLFQEDRAKHPDPPLLTEGCRSYVPCRAAWAEMTAAAEKKVREWAKGPGRSFSFEVYPEHRSHDRGIILWLLDGDIEHSVASDRKDVCWYEASLLLYRLSK
jgi:hypothetical protein